MTRVCRIGKCAEKDKFTLTCFITSTEGHKSFTCSNKPRECIRANNAENKLKGKFRCQTWFVDIFGNGLFSS